MFKIFTSTFEKKAERITQAQNEDETLAITNHHKYNYKEKLLGYEQ